MLPKNLKLSSQEFRNTIKRGRRAGTATVVVHLSDTAGTSALVRFGGPHFGLIVSKAVGNSVVRHRTYRRLRHICIAEAGNLPTSANVVIRALPSAGTATSEELSADVRHALERCIAGRDGKRR
ncbi:ribonuclease P protein component [Corynebacterium epidermidicanis]|uniref:ribonuclease P protein component n=1 Tax=Corynebacterium epidermidicanis TaxID=1050174 RepID=UPI000A04EF32|nr:ribonuclease P protein component [Corynebacterium epidermidicanis]